MAHIFLIIFIAGTVFEFLLNQILELSDYIARKNHGNEIPLQLKDYVDAELLAKTSSYKNAKYFLWIPKNIISTAIELITVLLLYSKVYEFVTGFISNPYGVVLLFMLFCSLPGFIAGIPFELIREFYIEKKFGFSKMTFGMWLADNLKGLILSLAASVVIIAAAEALLLHASSWWWIFLGAVYLAFSLFISYVYPIWFAPIFNKFTPLEDGELKNRLEKLLQKTGFKSNGIFVMDASKRSSHSNAYFTGFGKNKRIVLYDTLIKQLTPEEIEAVLAHELGHYKKHHITKKLFAVVPLVFIVLYAVSVLINLDSLYTSFGVLKFDSSVSAALISTQKLLGLMYVFAAFSPYSPLADLVVNTLSRRDEFQADAYSAQLCGSGKPLTTALIKLNKENLSEFTPSKIYVLFNYDHPSLLERMQHVEKVK